MAPMSDRQSRAGARADWPIRRFRLGEEPADDPRSLTTPEERVAVMWQLALDAWASAGRPIPDYPRGKTPIRVIPASEHGKDE